MTVYRRLARSKKGMSTIFGGLFFVILILMGFNVMLWGFVQFDSYNHVITSMSQRDQQAISENIVPVNATCDSGCKAGTGTLYVWVNNLGGSSVYIANVYLFNVNGSGICQPTPCVTGAVGGSANIPAGSVNFPVKIQGVAIGTYSFHIILATSRGRIFTLYYPWRFNSLTINQNGGGNFVTNIGPLAIYFDTKSFNFTQGSQTTSQSAFCLPASTPVILYLRVANTATDSNVTLLTQTGLQAQAYGVNGFGQFAHAWIEASNTVNPSTNFPYVYPSATDYVLAPAGPNGPGPSSFAVVKIGASGPGASGAVSFGNSNVSWITFIGLYYLYKNQVQGQTIPFMDFVTNAPNCIQ
ncbi:MAG TPA: hypothetical protein VFV92_11200 [Candidatus Bathyarchaeia archaeon]|nr:hypothetical protein [Candidatus Bathyarchaeia archaeon]